MLQKNVSEFSEVISLIIQYILIILEENVIHQCSNPRDPSTVSISHQFGPPTGNPHQHHRKEKAAPHLHTGDNKSKAWATMLSKTYPTIIHANALSKAKGTHKPTSTY
jgi:hypothetical protein